MEVTGFQHGSQFVPKKVPSKTEWSPEGILGWHLVLFWGPEGIPGWHLVSCWLILEIILEYFDVGLRHVFLIIHYVKFAFIVIDCRQIVVNADSSRNGRIIS